MTTPSPLLVSVSTDTPSRAEMEARMNELRAEFDALNRRYAHLRYAIYPPIQLGAKPGPHPLDVLIGRAIKNE